MNLSTLNMAGWSILDCELAIEGIRQVSNAAAGLQNQPRSLNKRQDYHPGADFIAQVGEGWCGSILDDLIKQLKAIRFDVPEEDDRRLRLLLIYYADHCPSGESVPRLMKMIAEQSVPRAAKKKSEIPTTASAETPGLLLFRRLHQFIKGCEGSEPRCICQMGIRAIRI